MNETKSYVDHLNRKDLAGQVLDTLLQQTHVKVMSLNGGWGSGKTYFLDFMREYAESKGILFITHNVWENDYLDDPFLSIVTIFLEALESVPANESAPISHELQQDLNDAKKWTYVLVELWKRLKLEISPTFSWKTPEGFQYSINAGKFKLESEKEGEKAHYISFPELKEKLTKKFACIIKKRKQPVIIAIDEVDRTRPEYAIRTLEVIKHFFDIDGLKFILAVDKKQLQNTVKQMFGQDTETDCYLRKFVDLEWNLPAPSLEMFVKAQLETETWDKVFARHKTYVYLDYYLGSPPDSNVLDVWHWEESLKDSFKERVQKSIVRWLGKDLPDQEHHMSLRDIEKFLSHFKIILQKIPEIHCIEVDMLVDLLYIYRKQPALFSRTYLFIQNYPLLERKDGNNLTSYIALFKEDASKSRLVKSLQRAKVFLNEGDLRNFRFAVRRNNSSSTQSITTHDEWHRLIEGLLTATLLDYYEAIQFAGGFNSDD